MSRDAFLTAPPESSAGQSLLGRAKLLLIAKGSAVLMPVVRKAAGSYIGGETVEEALSVACRLAAEGHPATLGYWDTGHQSPAECARIGLEAVVALGNEAFDGYVSLKPPALGFSAESAQTIARAAAEKNLRLHCDSHGPEAVAPSNAFAEALLAILPPEKVGTTLPGRWLRSLADADWAMARGLPVRVVKGQWPDPADPKRDLAEGFLAVIGRLCQGASHVAVATHDAPLAREAIARLKAANVSCEVEVLLGMPAAPLLAWTKETGVTSRIYVPYGPGFVPNAIGVLRRNPRLLVAVAKERVATAAAFVASVFSASPKR